MVKMDVVVILDLLDVSQVDPGFGVVGYLSPGTSRIGAIKGQDRSLWVRADDRSIRCITYVHGAGDDHTLEERRGFGRARKWNGVSGIRNSLGHVPAPEDGDIYGDTLGHGSVLIGPRHAGMIAGELVSAHGFSGHAHPGHDGIFRRQPARLELLPGQGLTLGAFLGVLRDPQLEVSQPVLHLGSPGSDEATAGVDAAFVAELALHERAEVVVEGVQVGRGVDLTIREGNIAGVVLIPPGPIGPPVYVKVG
jgi:hypothetical protein